MSNYQFQKGEKVFNTKTGDILTCANYNPDDEQGGVSLSVMTQGQRATIVWSVDDCQPYTHDGLLQTLKERSHVIALQEKLIKSQKKQVDRQHKFCVRLADMLMTSWICRRSNTAMQVCYFLHKMGDSEDELS